MKNLKCNADCPDVKFGSCCHLENCQKKNMTGIEIIAKERKRQIEELGFDCSNDLSYNDQQLARAAACYAIPANWKVVWDNNFWRNFIGIYWPWNMKFWKPTPDDRIKELAKAGALIAAQIDYELNKK